MTNDTNTGADDSSRSERDRGRRRDSKPESHPATRAAETIANRERLDSDLAIRLCRTLSDPSATSERVEDVLQDAIEVLETAEALEGIDDIGERDVRRRLDSLEAELQDRDGATYRHLVDRIRELEAMVDRNGDAVQLYAVYQECTFYDRTLLPRLARARSADQPSDVGRLAADVESRIETIEDEYVNVRADHNHTIPNHFLSLARDLRQEAMQLESERPERAVGLLSAADELLAYVEQLYDRNEYSVMLRRLRG
ncbi:hypothetical protein [Natronobacterium texcoconense]|uniref:Uncharacterized protein n=1 Tax=Natronobacterium texcoconense TaxID=1095778 RepID=A0A1H1J2H3_NATTX|nr:hypothetical protein [Natronobacterium texcoconense]SDR44184.1 hypothetical protein SAMN04489842_4062 [Natronobacterium texcoconense]